MAPSLRSFALSSIVTLALAGGCAGPPIPSPIEGEPVCPDITHGASRTEMEGGLHYPVRVRVLDGKSPILRLVLSGRRGPDDAKARTLIADDNGEYAVEWAQCPNERAPQAIDKGPKFKDPKNAEKSARVNEVAGYECGEAVVYKTTTLVTKKGDAASHVLTFEMPPKTECWVSDAPPPPPSAAPDASAAPAEKAAVPTETDAGAPSDAGDSDAGNHDAGNSDAAAPLPDAGTPSDAGAAKKN